MFEFTRQDAPVELVELHQLNQVCEFGFAVIEAEEDLAVLFTLNKNKRITWHEINNLSSIDQKWLSKMSAGTFLELRPQDLTK